MKSAVDFLVDVVQSCIAPDYIPKEIIKQAKEMEREQLKDAVINTYKEVDGYCWGLTAEEYYNEYIKTE